MAIVSAAAIFTPGAAAAPITYSITFTETSGSVAAPDPATFVYDASAAIGSQFSGFFLTWDGISYDLTAAANSPVAVGTDCGTDSAAVFSFLSTGSACPTHAPNEPRWVGVANARQNGNFFQFSDSNPLGPNGQPGTQSLLVEQSIQSRQGGGNSAQGTWTIADTSTPEPGTLVLLLAGGAMLVAGKRRA